MAKLWKKSEINSKKKAELEKYLTDHDYVLPKTPYTVDELKGYVTNEGLYDEDPLGRVSEAEVIADEVNDTTRQGNKEMKPLYVNPHGGKWCGTSYTFDVDNPQLIGNSKITFFTVRRSQCKNDIFTPPTDDVREKMLADRNTAGVPLFLEKPHVSNSIDG